MLLIRLVPVCLVLALAGCGSVGAISFPSFGKKTAEADADTISPAAVPPVEQSNLPPPPGAGQPQDGQATVAEALPNGADASGQTALPGTAPAPAPVASGSLGRTDLLGGWTIASSGDSCQLFMTLTSWTGGYRASTRGCTSDTLKSISAWNLEGKQVVLAGQGGVAVARLSSSGGNRFDGATEGGATPVTFYR
ncbi:MAG: AprI/Inh family metalloprotease inhibitor [Bauldia sp.]